MNTNKTPNISEPVTLTPEEIKESAQKRIAQITKEFTEGLDFVQKFEKSVTILGSSHLTKDNPYSPKAEALAKKIVSELGYTVVTGGGPGIMESANKGAKEAGGTSVGLAIELPQEQIPNEYLTDKYEFHYFFSRKVCLTYSAEAYVFFPGGFGTLNEFFEILMLVQTGKMNNVPIILYGSDFWNPIDDLVKNSLLKNNYIHKEDTLIYVITDNDNEVVDIIKNAPVRNGERFHEAIKTN